MQPPNRRPSMRRVAACPPGDPNVLVSAAGADTHLMIDDATTLATFRVAVSQAPFLGMGRLKISPGLVVVESWPAERRLVVHSDPEVRLVRTRVELHWWRWSLVLRGEAGPFGVTLPPRSAAEVREALTAAGFEVREQATGQTRLPGRLAPRAAAFQGAP